MVTQLTGNLDGDDGGGSIGNNGSRNGDSSDGGGGGGAPIYVYVASGLVRCAE